MDQVRGIDDAGYLQYLIWLCEHLSLLASEAHNQEVYLRSLGTWDLLDELGLEWDDYYDVLKSQTTTFSQKQLEVFDKVGEVLDAIPNGSWSGPSLNLPAWDNVRQAAAEALPVACEILHRLEPGRKIIPPGRQVEGKTFLGTNSYSMLLPHKGDG
jgi:hypothetical protein